MPQGGYYNPGTNYVATTTSSYVPATATTYAVGNGSGVRGGQTVTYTTTGGNAQNIAYDNLYAGSNERYVVSGGQGYTTQVGGQGYTTETRVAGGATIVGTTVNTGKEVIKGESRIEYVPFEKKIIEYKDEAKVERVPKKVKKVEYREERKIETIPKEVTVTDYYAVEYLRQYIPQYVPEKRIEYVQVPKKQVRYEYIPVERYFILYLDKLFTTQTSHSKSKDKLPSKSPTQVKSRLQDTTPQLMSLELRRDTSPEDRPNTSLEDRPNTSLEDKPEVMLLEDKLNTSPLLLPTPPPPTSLELNRDTSLELNMSISQDTSPELKKDTSLETQERPLILPPKLSQKLAATNTSLSQ